MAIWAYVVFCAVGVLVYFAILLSPLWRPERISYARAYVWAALYGVLFIITQTLIALHLIGKF